MTEQPSIDEQLELVARVHVTAVDPSAMPQALPALKTCLRAEASQIYTWLSQKFISGDEIYEDFLIPAGSLWSAAPSARRSRRGPRPCCRAAQASPRERQPHPRRRCVAQGAPDRGGPARSDGPGAVDQRGRAGAPRQPAVSTRRRPSAVLAVRRATALGAGRRPGRSTWCLATCLPRPPTRHSWRSSWPSSNGPQRRLRRGSQSSRIATGSPGPKRKSWAWCSGHESRSGSRRCAAAALGPYGRRSTRWL